MHEPEELEPGILRLTAPNPSPMTFRGTNTYVVGRGRRAVIDPGPADAAHLEAILAACPEGVSHILVTHAHRDHAQLARPLAARTGAPVLTFGPALSGRSAVMEALAARGLAGGGEGLDLDFVPDIALGDGARVQGDGWEIAACWTPGHVGHYLCFALGGVLFSGDHVMGWATSLVSPPDGDLTQFMASCRRLQGQGARRYYPGHGDPIEDPEARLAELIAHRLQRERQILLALDRKGATPAELTARVYTDVAPVLLPMAERNLFAHLVDLHGRGEVTAAPELAISANFRRAG